MFFKNFERLFLNFFSEQFQRLANVVRLKAERAEQSNAIESDKEKKAPQTEEKQIFENSSDDWHFRTQSLPPQNWLDRVRAGAPELLFKMPEYVIETDSAEKVLLMKRSISEINKIGVIDEKKDFVKISDKKPNVEQLSKAFQENLEAEEKTFEDNALELAKPKTQALLLNFEKPPKKQKDVVSFASEFITKKELARQQFDQQDNAGRDSTGKAVENKAETHSLSSNQEPSEKAFDCEISKKQKSFRFIFESKEATSETISSQNAWQAKSTIAKVDQTREKSRFEESIAATDFHKEKQISLLQTKSSNSRSHENNKSVLNNRKINWQTDKATIFNEHSSETNNSASNHRQQSNRPEAFDATNFSLEAAGLWIDLPEESILSERDELAMLLGENKRLQDLESEQTNRF